MMCLEPLLTVLLFVLGVYVGGFLLLSCLMLLMRGFESYFKFGGLHIALRWPAFLIALITS